jgi:hypothetical protein
MHWSHQDTQEGWHLLCDSLIKLRKDDNNDRSSTSARKTRSRSVGGLIGDGKSTSLPFIYVKLQLTFVGLASVAHLPNSSTQPLAIIAQPTIRIKFTLPEELLPSANLACHYRLANVALIVSTNSEYIILTIYGNFFPFILSHHSFSPHYLYPLFPNCFV